MYILRNVLRTFLMVLVRKIWPNIKTSLVIIPFILTTCMFDQVMVL